jgi:glutathione synthase
MPKLIIQMDRPEGFKYESDSTLALALEAQKRGYEISYFTPNEIAVVNGEIVAQTKPIRFFEQPDHFFEQESSETTALETADIILIRQEPPYNMQYLGTTWILERLKNPKIYNNPTAIRNRPEKLFPMAFPDYLPESCISEDTETLVQFRKKHGDVVVKPLYGFGGADIELITSDEDEKFETLIGQDRHEPIILQPYLPEVMTEEKRIILIDGELTGAYNRRPSDQDFRTNGAVGGSAHETKLTPIQQKIASKVGKFCKEEGLMLIGLDVIGDKLIEINTTCPTGLRMLEKLYGINAAGAFWDAVEAQA